MEYLLILAVIVILFLIMFFLIYQNNLKQQMFMRDLLFKSENSQNAEMDNLRQQISHDLIRFQSLMSNNINDDINRLNENTANRLNNIERGVNEGLLAGFNKTGESYANVLKQVERMSEVSNNLKDLSLNISSFNNLLTDKKTRGIFGEVSLYNILNIAFDSNDNLYLKQHKLSNGYIVDCLLICKEPLGNIAIDSKFPLENYNRLFEDNVNIHEVKNSFKKDVLKHINDIKNKYIIKGETASIAYMYIPAEAVFSKIYSEFDEIIQASYAAKVYLVSPTTLMAYITVMQAINLDQKRNEKALEIQQEFDKLSKEFGRFNERFIDLRRDFDRVYKEMNNMFITMEKIINRFKQIEAVNLKGDADETTD